MSEADPAVGFPVVARFFLASAGFVEGDLETVGRELVSWRTELGYRPTSRRVTGDLPAQLVELNPLLTGARPRELLVSAGRWVAYFDSFARDTDAESTCSVLAERLGTHGVAIGCAPAGLEFNGMKLSAGVQFHLFGPEGEKPLGNVRTIDMIMDDSRWLFEQSGDPLPFEEVENYAKRRIKDRFTAGLLQRYCRELRIDLFDLGSYGPEGLLIESKVVVPQGTREVWI